jgi:CRISPR-associated protein Csm3
MKRVKHFAITGETFLLSSMRIGGNDDFLQIGATDLTVIKHPETLEPYIPGSSLKGKMRSQLELQFGLCKGAEPFGASVDLKRIAGLAPAQYLLATVFGPHKNVNHELGPTRIIVRDGSLLHGGNLEIKPEVMISRATGVGEHPRTMERVASGSAFRLKIDLQVFDIDETNAALCKFDGKTGGEAMVHFVLTGLKLVEETGLGASVSRGSGEVEFRNVKVDGVTTALPVAVPTS